MSAPSAALDKGLPANLDAERFVLGSILLDDTYYVQVAGALDPDDFCLESHRRIFLRMTEVHERGEKIDRVTVANELMRHSQLEAIGGLTYLISLDDGLPQIFNIDSYVRIVKEKSILRKVIFTAQGLISKALAQDEDPASILATAEETLLRLGDQQLTSGLVTPSRILEEYEGGINAFLDPSKRIKGVSTGFAKLDEMTGGLHGGELIILAARPSMGKTALALNIAQHVAVKTSEAVAVFSLEMSKESLLTRMLCATARVDSHRFRAGYLNSEERRRLQQALAELAEAPLYIDDTAGLTLMDMHAKLRRLKSERRIGMVIVDYLQLMSGGSRRFENRVQEVSALSRGLKLLAKELSVPMVVLSQLSRAPETRQGDHRPQLSDLRESGCLSGDTLVSVAAAGAPVPIRELAGRSDFPVWALDQQSRRLREVPVSRAFSTGCKPVFKLTTGLGRSIRATANHRFLTPGGWRRLDRLAPGDRLALPAPAPLLSRSFPSRDRKGAVLGTAGSYSTVLEEDADPLTSTRLDSERPAASEVHWDPVVSIHPNGVDEVFDLTVPGLHNFVAGGIVVHNSIEQDADLVGFIFREEVYKRDDSSLRGLAELIISKQRNGPIGKIDLVFLHHLTKFENRAEDLGDESGAVPPPSGDDSPF